MTNKCTKKCDEAAELMFYLINLRRFDVLVVVTVGPLKLPETFFFGPRRGIASLGQFAQPLAILASLQGLFLRQSIPSNTTKISQICCKEFSMVLFWVLFWNALKYFLLIISKSTITHVFGISASIYSLIS